MVRAPIQCGYTEKELRKMSRSEAQEGMNGQQIAFCEHYVTGHNYKMALIKAGYNQGSVVSGFGTRLVRNPKCARYIAWLKIRATDQCIVNAADIIDAWVRIAFADMTDFVDIFPNSIRLKPVDKVDGELIKSIKSGRDGVSIELHDKLKALDNLAKYTQDMPQDWKQKIENRRMELLEEEFELKKQLVSLENPTIEDDGFIQAIKESAKSVWKDEGEE